ncbi:MAG: hypothetical protein ACLFWB_07910 [Armatimonadota bacterium]
MKWLIETSGVNGMSLFDTSEDDRPYREKFFDAAISLHHNLKYLVFFYIIGSAFAVIAMSTSPGPGSADFSLASVLIAYGIAALALVIFLYAFIKTLILACCAYGEWLCEEPGRVPQPHSSEE